ncbi:ABC transporter substrate-binding protein [Chitinimonas sp. BJYL2]|uniref:substrate-binding periplasmic protein n=1 Tax=Chitinimonas sp. BJYL2 TaxID=2976696 RepID=UPI0022B36E7B|nr:transporter substrate-binding domain-containing protein [Chitinimonas sp. BJYL2]
MHNALRLSLLGCLTAATVAAEVRIVLCECDSPPLMEFAARHEPSGGLIKEISDLIVHQMHDTPQYEVLSRKRIDLALAKGEADMVCFSNPAWTSLSARLQWSTEIMPQVEKVLLDAQRAAQTQSVNDLRGMRIGLIHGFHYPALDPLIQSGQIKPVYERDPQSNFRLLEHGLVDGVVSSDLQHSHYLRTRTGGRALGLSTLTVSTTPTHCAVPKASALPMDKVNTAIQQLKQQGAFDKLLQRYRALPTPTSGKP